MTMKHACASLPLRQVQKAIEGAGKQLRKLTVT
jgi:hypothetical protein